MIAKNIPATATPVEIPATSSFLVMATGTPSLVAETSVMYRQEKNKNV